MQRASWRERAAWVADLAALGFYALIPVALLINDPAATGPLLWIPTPASIVAFGLARLSRPRLTPLAMLWFALAGLGAGYAAWTVWGP